MLGPRSFLSFARLSAGFLSPRCRSGRNWSDALSLVQSGACAAVSLDCFDTLLARGIPDWEQHVLAETAGMEAGLSAHQALNSLCLARERAQRLAAGDEEPTAASIWTQYCIIIGIPERAAAQLCTHELKLLEMTSIASADALNLVATIQAHQLPWFVCSDTRWSASLLSGLLRGKGFAIAPESIFSSSDHHRSKFRGGLYSIAYRHLVVALGREVPPSAILHVGDNFFADNCSAASFGMRTVNVPAASLQPGQAAGDGAINTYLESVRRDLAFGRL
jgi:FMN phosphatase YigB (HAD superfamily)